MRNTLVTSIVLVVLSALGLLASASSKSDSALDTKVRVGTFDSRALAIAYYRSDDFNKEVREKMVQLKKLKEAGKEDEAAALEEKGKTMQQVVHKQGFGTWPVGNILAKVKSGLPGVAQKADVQVIVSKWDVAYQDSKAELVDVTDLMVDLLEPDAETRKVISEIRKKAPVPNEQFGSLLN